MMYLLDTTTGFDFCPAFRDWLAQMREERTIFGVECVGRFRMLRRERARFVLGK